jgi:psp operon transcriptional activator
VVERAVYHSTEGTLISRVNFDPFASPFRLQETTSTPKRPKQTQPSSAPEITPTDFKAYMAEMEQRLLLQALAENRYNQKQTAAALSLSYHQLRGYLKKYKLNPARRK